jgi:hypothetical protein
MDPPRPPSKPAFPLWKFDPKPAIDGARKAKEAVAAPTRELQGHLKTAQELLDKARHPVQTARDLFEDVQRAAREAPHDPMAPDRRPVQERARDTADRLRDAAEDRLAELRSKLP